MTNGPYLSTEYMKMIYPLGILMKNYKIKTTTGTDVGRYECL